MIVKRLYCKRAAFMQHDKTTFQNKLAAALLKLKTVGKRKQVSGEDERYVRAIIYHRTYGDMLFCILASYERGTHQLTVSDDDDAEMLSVAQVAPPKGADNKRQEFLEGTCYLGVSKNHVLLVGSRSLGSRPTEHYLNWLLEQAGVLGSSNRLGLSDEVAQATRERILASHVKELEIGTPFFDAQTEEGAAAPIKVGATQKAFEYSGLGIDLLRQVLGANKVDHMRLADAIDGNIEVTLKVKYKRKTTEKAHKVLDNIALAMRNLEGEDVKLTLAGGGTVSGNELKLSAGLSVEARDGIPNPDALFEKMRAWLLAQIENRIIEP
ncbi:hypothetical protein [Hydrogenophaga sp.]|uniref:hypothetical protein n=1 Tax=Hydrogenophaga sp. TaxID=1904254 RepID=UPI002FCA90AC